MIRKINDEFPVSHQVDGNNVKQIANNPRILEIERQHIVRVNQETGKRVERDRDDD